jgi:Ca-activated chloride channel family protein
MTFKQTPRKLFSQLTFFSFLIFVVVSASAQGEKPAAPPESLGRITLIVTDRADRAVEDVRKEDLQVIEDGAGQTISYFARDERPITCGIVVDASGSVRRILGQLIDSAKLAASGLREGDEGFVARFVDRDIFQIKQELTGDLEAVADTLDDIYVEGGQTAVHDALDKTLKYFEENQSGPPNSRRQILVLITDGEDRASRIKDSKEVLARLRQSNVQVFVLGLTKFSGLQSSEKKAIGLLEDMADQSGGRAFFPDSPSGLPNAAREIARNLHLQFAVGYASNKSTGERRIQAKWIGRSDQGNRKVITKPVVSPR